MKRRATLFLFALVLVAAAVFSGPQTAEAKPKVCQSVICADPFTTNCCADSTCWRFCGFQAFCEGLTETTMGCCNCNFQL